MPKRGRPKSLSRIPYKTLLLQVPAELIEMLDRKKDSLNSCAPELAFNRAQLIRLGISWIVSTRDEEILRRSIGKVRP